MEMSLGAQLDQLLLIDEQTLSGVEHNRYLAELLAVQDRLQAAVLDKIAAFEARGTWSLDGAHSAANWLPSHTGMSRAAARSECLLAKRLALMPIVASAYADGSISTGHVRVFARAVANVCCRERFAEFEEQLVGYAQGMTVDETSKLVDQWMLLADQDGVAPADRDDDTLAASIVGSRVKLNGDFGLAVGVPLLAAINELADRLFHADMSADDPAVQARTPTRRRAEALAALVGVGATVGSDGASVSREPLFFVHVDVETLATGQLHSGSVNELSDGTVVPPAVLERWACGARFSRILFNETGAVLEMGRAVRYATTLQRQALHARDRGCAVPGCDRPPSHCDAHHVQHWGDGGSTDIKNLVLLCRHHHRAIHAGSLQVSMVDGVPGFADRHGIPLGVRRPPDWAHAS